MTPHRQHRSDGSSCELAAPDVVAVPGMLGRAIDNAGLDK